MTRKPNLALVPSNPLEQADNMAREYASNDRSSSTRTTYAWAMRDYTAWCRGHGLPDPVVPFPPEHVAAWIAESANQGLCAASIKILLAAVSRIHTEAGLESPTRSETVRATWRGIRRTKGTAVEKKHALTAEEIVRMAAAVQPGNHKSGRHYRRDRAIILFGWASGLRRSELCQLTVNDLTFSEAGVVINLSRSKTDQEGKGRRVAIPRGADNSVCPVVAIEAWLRTRQGRGNLFQCCAVTFAFVLKHYAAKIGIDPATIAGHSLRRGVITQAARNGASEREIAQFSGHKDLKTLRGYIEDGQLFNSNVNGIRRK